MGYEFEAFFSYKRDPESDSWHERVKEKLEFWVRQELGNPTAKIFFDREDIRTGERWKERISERLLRSKCIICIWSPLYFRSQWCIAEWNVFDHRARLLKADLVIPASYHDGKSFPAEARATQMEDFSNYASTIPRFWDTDLAVEFDQKIRKFASELAQRILKAPPFDSTFLTNVLPEPEAQQEPTIGRIANN
jgi:hypothetical protein